MVNAPADNADESRTVNARVQSTVTGYTAWALQRLAKRKGQSFASIGAYALDRWVDENAKYLAQFGITLNAFELEMEHAPLPFGPRDA